LFDQLTFGGTFWEIVGYIYVRFFGLNPEDNEAGFRLSPTHDFSLSKNLLKVKSHPYYGKCVIYTPDKVRKDLGLYYFYAKL
jgi:hypothetical protein